MHQPYCFGSNSKQCSHEFFTRKPLYCISWRKTPSTTCSIVWSHNKTSALGIPLGACWFTAAIIPIDARENSWSISPSCWQKRKPHIKQHSSLNNHNALILYPLSWLSLTYLSGDGTWSPLTLLLQGDQIKKCLISLRYMVWSHASLHLLELFSKHYRHIFSSPERRTFLILWNKHQSRHYRGINTGGCGEVEGAALWSVTTTSLSYCSFPCSVLCSWTKSIKSCNSFSISPP